MLREWWWVDTSVFDFLSVAAMLCLVVLVLSAHPLRLPAVLLLLLMCFYNCC